MTIRTTGLAAMLAMALAAPPAGAQEVGSGPLEASAEEVNAVMADLLAQLDPFARQHGIPGFQDEVRAVLETSLGRSLIFPPTERTSDPDYNWGSGFRFDIGYDVPQDGVLTPNREHPVHQDAQACSQANGNGPVAHFRRIRQGAFQGHICAVRRQDGDRAILVTRSVFEGAGRRGWTNLEIVARVAGDPQAASDLLAPVIDHNIALAEAFDEAAIRSLPLAAPNRPAATVPADASATQ